MESIFSATSAAGGKALGLKRLLELGVAVPDAVVLSAEEVQELIGGDSKLISELSHWLELRSSRIAVRSSAEHEDGPQRSFAGIYESKLSVAPTLSDVIAAIAEVSSSGQSGRALAYAGYGVDRIPVIIQNQIESRISGVFFTAATAPNGAECAYIEWTQGLGDKLVSGRVTPSSVQIPWISAGTVLDQKATLSRGSLLPSRDLFSLLGLIEDIGKDNVLGWDVEWAIDDECRLWALQLRAQTVPVMIPDVFGRLSSLLPASAGIGEGPARMVDDNNYNDIREGEVLVAQITEATYVPAMMRAAAIVTEEGGLLSHAAIVARELGKPCVVGFAGALTLLKSGEITEVNGSIGTVRQRNKVFGSEQSAELDWKSVYLYDRGILFDNPSVYVEPNPEGLIAFVDDEPTPIEIADISRFVRRTFHRSGDVLVGDRAIWFREWRRYKQLHSLSVISSQFDPPLYAWDIDGINRAVRLLKESAQMIIRLPSRDPMDKLFLKEIGAAFHALVSEVVEGRATWYGFRDSMEWRASQNIQFADILRGASLKHPNAPARLSRMSKCLTILGQLRNDAYAFFEQIGAFSRDYYPEREALVREVCAEVGLTFETEDYSLSELYCREELKIRDRSFYVQLVPLISKIHSTKD